MTADFFESLDQADARLANKRLRVLELGNQIVPLRSIVAPSRFVHDPIQERGGEIILADGIASIGENQEVVSNGFRKEVRKAIQGSGSFRKLS